MVMRVGRAPGTERAAEQARHNLPASGPYTRAYTGRERGKQQVARPKQSTGQWR
jgi:hypothetical protein